MPVVIREEEGNREKGQDNQQSSQSLPRPGSAISHQPPSDGQRNRPGGNKNGCLEVARFIVEVLTFIIGFATLIALLFYVKATYHQVHEMRKANRIARDALTTADRPWIGVVPSGLRGLEVGKSPQVKLTMKNYGKNPGISVAIFTTGIGVVSSGTPITDYVPGIKASPRQDIGTLWPGQKLSQFVTLPIPLTAQDFDDIRNRRQELTIYGVLVYKDTALTEHHTWIEIVYFPEGLGSPPGLTSRHSKGAPSDD